MTTPLAPEVLDLQRALAGRYSIDRELGRGGMGVVLLARDVALDRLVAIKLLPPALAADPGSRDRFLREARIAAGLSHPNIVPIHAVEEHGLLVFFVMGYVDGETLRERVEREGPLPPRLAMQTLQDVAWALGYAHQRGVVHRDIKPDNIMLERATDRALVTDFGIALGRGREGPAGEVIGTARYMSPEQAAGEPVDGRSDLYSLGATYFFALTGRPPFEGRTLPAILSQQLQQAPPALKSLRPEVPDKLAQIVTRCLARSPADRFQMSDDLARVVGEVRGRDFRAPPVVRSFLRNAQVCTMVVVASILAGQNGVTTGHGGTSVSISGPGLIGTILIIQLVIVARRLLRSGYAFDDIRAALLAEAQVQREEAEAVHQRRIFQRIDSLWHKLWAGRFGRWFFRVAGMGIATRPRGLPSGDATELVLGRSALAAYEGLTADQRDGVRDVPVVIDSLERRAARLRADGATGEDLTQAVAALENLRLELLRLEAGTGSLADLTVCVRRARAIGEAVDRRLAGG